MFKYCNFGIVPITTFYKCVGIPTIIGICFLLFVFCCFSANATTLERGVSSSVEIENNPRLAEVYRLKIENQVNGEVSVSLNKGFTWEAVGKVLYPTQKMSKRGFAAAKWIEPGKIAATAVNAIHIKVGAVDWDRSIFSILPREFLMPPKYYRSFLSPNSSIYTDILAGQGIFGGGYAPFVGNQVFYTSNGIVHMTKIPRDYNPKIGDTYYIIVKKPVVYPKEMIFENRFGGKITIKYFSGEEKVIGQVLKPVVGIGRFSGGKYLAPGRIRANHPGVIDVAVSPQDQVGGFQIVPALHGDDMEYVKSNTQWMVIGPTDVDDPSLEGIAPFFKHFIQPSYQATSLESEMWNQNALASFLVDVKYVGDDDWYPIPIFEINKFYLNKGLPKRYNTSLKNVSHFRFLFPIKE